MKKSKYSEEQIATALRQVEARTPVAEVTRKLGMCEATYYAWRKKYNQMGVAEIRRLRQLEDENRKLKQLVADLTLDKVMAQKVLAKSCQSCTQTGAGDGAGSAVFRSGCAARVGCFDSIAAAGTIARIRGMTEPFEDVFAKLAQARPRLGFQRIHVLLRREGWLVNRKRVHRIYREEGPHRLAATAPETSQCAPPYSSRSK